MPVQGLGYVGVEAREFDPWRTANEVRRATVKSGLGAPLQITRGQYNEVQ